MYIIKPARETFSTPLHYMKIISAIFILMFSNFSFSYEMPPIVQEWRRLKGNYQTYMVSKNYDKAITEAKKLLGIDPSNDEAKFYLRYAYLKSKKELPSWLNEEGGFTRKTEGSFYKKLASELEQSN
jgi:hypothetical protein